MGPKKLVAYNQADQHIHSPEGERKRGQKNFEEILA